jgi:hypothetical protein
MRQRTLMVEHHAEIAAIDLGTARLALDKVFGFVGRRIDGFADVLAAWDVGHWSRRFWNFSVFDSQL